MSKWMRAMAVVLAAAAMPASAQVWDFTGNGLLNGQYVFRELIVTGSGTGSIARAITVYGTITFNSAAGTYAVAANAIDSGQGAFSYNQSGTYSISPTGYGFLKHPFATSGTMHGMISNGIFIGSSTESGINDILIAVPAGSATSASFSGNYTMNYINVTSGGPSTNTYNSIAQVNPNGGGGIGTVPVKTYLGNTPTTVNQNESNVSYTFSGGVGTLRFPTTANLAIRGDKQMFISPDGNFIFGGSIATGSSTAWDLFVGVKKSASPPKLDGLFYQIGFEHLPGSLDTFYGALNFRNGVTLEHQRYLSTANATPINYTATGSFPDSSTADYVDNNSAIEYSISQDGAIRIGVGQSPYMGLRLAVRGPTFVTVGDTPYINPTGVINAASFAPFTAGVAPGELLSIYGENLATSTVVTQGGVPFPTTLGNVRVLMNNRPAALYFVSPNQIAAIVPYGTTEQIVQIQADRNGTLSNAVTAFRYLTGPGIFSQAQSGEGLGAVLHPDFSLVTEANPARPGETVQVFLTGIGPVFPSIPDGGLGGTSTLNQTSPGAVVARVDNLDAEVAYAGLAPGLAGLYQVNVKVPNNSSTGNVYLDISTGDATTSQVKLPVGSATSASDEVWSVRWFERRR